MERSKKKWDGEPKTKITYFDNNQNHEKTPAFGDFWYRIPYEFQLILRLFAWLVRLPVVLGKVIISWLTLCSNFFNNKK